MARPDLGRETPEGGRVGRWAEAVTKHWTARDDDEPFDGDAAHFTEKADRRAGNRVLRHCGIYSEKAVRGAARRSGSRPTKAIEVSAFGRKQ